MNAFFISYRRTDSQEVVGRIYDRLIAQFSKARVFRDLDNILPGNRFAEVLEDALKQSTAVLVVIGPAWTSVTDGRGNRRLDNPLDFVRREVETAIALGLPVIPVLVSNASLPASGELRESIRLLLNHQGINVRPDASIRVVDGRCSNIHTTLGIQI
jgi:hypothetical protein